MYDVTVKKWKRQTGPDSYAGVRTGDADVRIMEMIGAIEYWSVSFVHSLALRCSNSRAHRLSDNLRSNRQVVNSDADGVINRVGDGSRRRNARRFTDAHASVGTVANWKFLNDRF